MGSLWLIRVRTTTPVEFSQCCSHLIYSVHLKTVNINTDMARQRRERGSEKKSEADVPKLSDGDHHEDLQQAQHDGLESQPDPLLHHALALLLSPLLCGQSSERQA